MSSTRKIRSARADDANAISNLAFQSKKYWGYDDAFMASCRAELTYSRLQIDAPELDFQVCVSGNDIIAFYALDCLEGDVAELDALFIKPGCIRTGLGTVLIEHAKSNASRRGYKKILTQCDPNTEQFYRSVGALPGGYRESVSIKGRMLPLFEIDLTEYRGREELIDVGN